MAEDTLYISVEKDAIAEITEKKSRFIAHIRHVETEEAAMEFVDKIRKQHFSARHNVYAYILSGGIKKYTDDGEPSKTAGLPILEMLEKQGITDVVCVVTRYFGGTLLGTGGLVRAYTDSAKEALNASGIVTMTKCDLLEINIPYSALGSMEYILKNHKAICEDKNYAENISLTVCIQTSLKEGLIDNIRNEFANTVPVLLKGQVYRNL